MRATSGASLARAASFAFSTVCSHSFITLSNCLSAASHCLGSNLKVLLLSLPSGPGGCWPLKAARLVEFQKFRCWSSWPTEWFFPSDQAACSGVRSATASFSETNQFFWLWVSCSCVSRNFLRSAGDFCVPLCCAKTLTEKNKNNHNTPFFMQFCPFE